ncbi:hypothetical protein MFRU_037g00650 [Monilinia fructicola]|nr:hypothetical protein MFRU_037g00650 [Monilinia fructicola]
MSHTNLTIHHHLGPFPTPESRRHPALRFLENYIDKINSASYQGSYLPYYHPRSTFHDATGVDYIGGAAIWRWIRELFGGDTFSRIEMECKEFLVVGGWEDGGWKIYGEWMAHWWVKETGEKISVPRSMVFRLVRAEGEGRGKNVDGNGEMVEDVGFEGLQIGDVRLYYDRSLLLGVFKRSEERDKLGG